MGAAAENQRWFAEAEAAAVEAAAAGIEYQGRVSPTWTFASLLKAHPTFANLDADRALAIVDHQLEIGGTSWSEEVPDCDVYGTLISDPRADFWGVWETVTRPLYKELSPRDALPFVDRWPLESERWRSPADRNLGRAVSICYYLARLLDQGGRFYLSCRTAGEVLGIDYRTAAVYLRQATQAGFLKVERAGSRQQATEYRFNFEVVTFAESAEVVGVAS